MDRAEVDDSTLFERKSLLRHPIAVSIGSKPTVTLRYALFLGRLLTPTGSVGSVAFFGVAAARERVVIGVLGVWAPRERTSMAVNGDHDI